MEAHTPRVPSREAREAGLRRAHVDIALRTDTSLFAANEYIVGRARLHAEESSRRSARPTTQRSSTSTTPPATCSTIWAEQRDPRRYAGGGRLRPWGGASVSTAGSSTAGRCTSSSCTCRSCSATRGVPRRAGRRPGEHPRSVRHLLELAGPRAVDPRPFSTSLVGRTALRSVRVLPDARPVREPAEERREAHPELDLPGGPGPYCVVYEGARKLVYATDGGHQLYDVGGQSGASSANLVRQPGRAATRSRQARPRGRPDCRSTTRSWRARRPAGAGPTRSAPPRRPG